jgi:hypothetical protein
LAIEVDGDSGDAVIDADDDEFDDSDEVINGFLMYFVWGNDDFNSFVLNTDEVAAAAADI